MNAHANLVGVYQDTLKARAVQAAMVTSLGQNPTQNRLIERTELQKACISRLAATDLYLANFDDISCSWHRARVSPPQCAHAAEPACTPGVALVLAPAAAPACYFRPCALL